MPFARDDIRFEKRANAIGYYWLARAPKSTLLAHLRGQSLDMLKEASIGGEQESGFEQAFSSLAYAYLKDKSPRLLDYMIGFQLVDRNEDNTKAMGLFGFKVGDQWYYAPTFFLNGDLKGHELLYIKKQDAFVPMKENWVNYLISRKPYRLGEGSEQNTWEMGGLPPDLMRLTTPPTGSKYGTDTYRPEVQEWARPFLTFIGAAAIKSDKFFTKHATASQALDLRGVLTSPLLAKLAVDMAVQYPLIKAGFDRFYGKDFFVKLGKVLDVNERSVVTTRPTPRPAKRADDSPFILNPAPAWQHPVQTGELRIITLGNWSAPRKVADDSSSILGPVKEASIADSYIGSSLANQSNHAARANLLRDAMKMNYTPDEAGIRADMIGSAQSGGALKGGLLGGGGLGLLGMGAGALLNKFSGGRIRPGQLGHATNLGTLGGLTGAAGGGIYGSISGGRSGAREADEYIQRIRQQAAQQAAKPKMGADDKTPEPDMEAPGGTELSGDIPEEGDKEKLLHDGVLIQDDRDPHGDKVSVAYNTQVRMEMQNPGETGIYEVLEKPGSFDKMLIIMHPHTNRGRRQFCTVIRLSDPRNWLNTHATNLWTKVCHCPTDKDWKEWFDKLPDSSSMTKGGYYVAIGPNGASTTPFRIQESYDDKKYTVDFKDYTSWADRPRALGKIDEDNDSIGFDYVSGYNAKLWINDKPGAGLRSVAGELAVPGNFKILKLKDPPKPRKSDDGIICCFPPESGGEGSKERPIRPGNLVDVQMMIFEKTAALKLIGMGSEVFLKSPLGEQRLQKTAALISLVRDHLFTEATAREMLKTAAVKGNASYRVKYAQPNLSVLAGGPGAPAFPEPMMGMERAGTNSVPSIYPQEQFNQIPELQTAMSDPAQHDPFIPPDQNAMQMAQQAAQSGQKEVFDTAMVSGMLKAVRQDTLVDRYLGDLMKALDKLGRILFMFYWHQEEFEDRYGKQDLPELEDSIRNAFETLGDVCLFLKEKQVGSMDDMVGVGNPEPNITEAARN